MPGTPWIFFIFFFFYFFLARYAPRQILNLSRADLKIFTPYSPLLLKGDIDLRYILFAFHYHKYVGKWFNLSFYYIWVGRGASLSFIESTISELLMFFQIWYFVSVKNIVKFGILLNFTKNVSVKITPLLGHDIIFDCSLIWIYRD